MNDASAWIERLGLSPHPEGGFYRETYRAALAMPQSALPSGFTGPRHLSTAIYFLLRDREFSAFHRIRSDEMWHFYFGSTLSIHVIDAQGNHVEQKLGLDIAKGEQPQLVVPAGCWFASCLLKGEGCSLVGCTVSPGFDFADFEMADRSSLLTLYPQHRSLIELLSTPSERNRALASRHTAEVQEACDAWAERSVSSTDHRPAILSDQ